jgi:hypothetical protein
VETRVKLNDAGDSNGEMAIWINGIKKGEWKKGQPTVPGGVTSTKLQDQKISIQNPLKALISEPSVH